MDPDPTTRQQLVTCLGESMSLLTPPAGSSLVDTDKLELHVAGAEGNVACGLAHLGIPTAWASRVGDDPLGARMTDFLASRGVSVELVETDPVRPTGVMFKDRTAAGSRVHYYRRGSAASAIDRSMVERITTRGTTLVHLSGINAAVSDSLREVCEQVLLARALGATITSFDVNHRPALWSADQAAAPLRELADHADIVFVGLDEAERLWGTSTPEQVRQTLPTPDLVVVKDAERGAWCLGAAGDLFEPALQVEVVDVVGAGDAFAAGFLAGRALGRTPSVGLRLGHLLAACTICATADAPVLPPAPTLLALAESGLRFDELRVTAADLDHLDDLLDRDRPGGVPES